MNKEQLEKLMEHIELKMAIKKVDKEPFGYEEIQLIKLCKICSELQQENNQLKEQKQELRSWLEKQVFNRGGSSVDIAIEIHSFSKVLDKLNELEGKNE